MKVLLTGASSFTGYWFAKALSEAGFEVLAPLRGTLASEPEGMREVRVRRLASFARVVESTPFGSDRFLSLAREGFDVLAHHAAVVGDYRSPNYDVAGAVAENTHNVRQVLQVMRASGLKAVVHTGSVFEAGEGAGEGPVKAFSPYGLSKGLSAQIVQYWAQELGIRFGKFVIPNPFGAFEEPRFCAYLIRAWKNGEIARVNTPSYVRDNIHVDLLALAYVRFVRGSLFGTEREKLNPSGYVEAQGRFAERFADAMRSRLNLSCSVELAVQTEFPEPVMRVNLDPAARYVEDWDEEAAWSSIAAAYRA